MQKSTTYLGILVSFVLTNFGCTTIEGIGNDISSAEKSIEGVFNGDSGTVENATRDVTDVPSLSINKRSPHNLPDETLKVVNSLLPDDIVPHPSSELEYETSNLGLRVLAKNRATLIEEARLASTPADNRVVLNIYSQFLFQCIPYNTYDRDTRTRENRKIRDIFEERRKVVKEVLREMAHSDIPPPGSTK